MNTANTNCLYGFKCPACHSLEPFRIEISTVIDVWDDGGGEHDNQEWNDASYCECTECGKHGTVRDFTTDP